MKNSIKLAGAVVVAAMVASAGSAFAAPNFTVDNGKNADDFTTALGYFDQSDIDALGHAKDVKVVTYNNWDYDGRHRASSLSDQISADAPQISNTQQALAADPAALKVLKAGGISVGSVDRVEAGHDGMVTVYVE